MRIKKPPSEAVAFGLLMTVALSILAVLLFNTVEQNKLRNAKVDVLTNWTLTVDATRSYKPGDTITAESRFTKLRDIKGESERSIQCLRPEYYPVVKDKLSDPDYKIPNTYWDGRTVSNEASGTAPKTKNGKTTINIGVPLAVGQLPNICRVYLSIVYNVDKYHPAFVETIQSNPFNMESRPGVVSLEGNQTFIYTDGSSPNNSMSSILIAPQPGQPVIINRTTPPQTQTETAPATPQPQQPGILDRILNVIPGVNL